MNVHQHDGHEEHSVAPRWSQARIGRFLLAQVLPPVVLLLLFLSAWQLYASLRASIVLPGPWEVTVALWHNLPTITATHLVPSLNRVLLGFILGLAVGGTAGVLLPLNRTVYSAFQPFLEFFRSMPATALFPFFLTVLGNNDFSRMATAVYITTWVTAFNVSRAMLRVGVRRKEYLQVLRASLLFRLRHLYLYELAPAFLTSARITLSLTLLVMIAVEMLIGARTGLGKLIFDSHYLMDYASMTATIMVVGLLGLVMNKIAEIAEGRFVYWRDE